MSNDPNIYRSPVRTIGNVEDEAATNSTDGWSIPSLLKGIYHLLAGTITVTNPVGAATAANQATEISSLASIDGHVDGLETLVGATNTALSTIDGHVDGLEGLITSSNTKLDTLHTDLATTIAAYVDGLEALIGTTNSGSASILAKLSADPATQTTLAAVLAKIIAAPATEAKQDTGNTSLASIVTALATNHTDELQLHTDIATTLIAKEEAIRALLAGTLTVGLPSGAATAANQTTQHTDLVNLLTQTVLAAGTNAIGKLAANSGVTIGAVELAAAQTLATVTAVTAITNALPAGSNLIGRAVADASAATGGIASTARLPSAAASTNATNVKTSAGRVYSVCGKNNAAYDVFLVLYDSAANPPVPGTTTIRKKVPCPAGQAFVYDFNLGLSFASGIGYAFTKLVADADTTVLVAADITAFNLDYV